MALVVHGSLLSAAAQETKPAAGKTKDLPKEVSVDLGKGIRLEMVLIPAGEFLMGSPDSETYLVPHEKPQHRVRITKPFYLGKVEVTQEQWETVMRDNPSAIKWPTNPVEKVTWADCQDFLKGLNAKVGGAKFQLPSEAQWEYACRAGSKSRFCFGDDEKQLRQYAWYGNNSGGHPHPVGGKKPNAWGLYDMHGNVGEWCADFYDAAYYANSPSDDPTGPATGVLRVWRGGAYLDVGAGCRSPERGGAAGVGDDMSGFRVSRVVPDNSGK
jgi:formylglycine-generating enzyme required for sulfatase activity